MNSKLNVIFSPAEIQGLVHMDFSDTACVVFDILRATTSIVTALANGAEKIIPVQEISEAIAIRRAQPDVLLAGERDGVRIRSSDGGVDFNFGNSPREFTREKVSGRTIVTTTTNGTRALRAAAKSKLALAGSFLNLRATADFISKTNPSRLLLICSGTYENAALEDSLAAGALCDLLWDNFQQDEIGDSAEMARKIFLESKCDLVGALRGSWNARRLNSVSELRDDVPFCLQRDIFNLVALLGDDGAIRKVAD